MRGRPSTSFSTTEPYKISISTVIKCLIAKGKGETCDPNDPIIWDMGDTLGKWEVDVTFSIHLPDDADCSKCIRVTGTLKKAGCTKKDFQPDGWVPGAFADNCTIWEGCRNPGWLSSVTNSWCAS